MVFTGFDQSTFSGIAVDTFDNLEVVSPVP